MFVACQFLLRALVARSESSQHGPCSCIASLPQGLVGLFANTVGVLDLFDQRLH